MMITVILVALSGALLVSAYPHGAPNTACGSIAPGLPHRTGGTGPQQGPPQFAIRFPTTAFTSGMPVGGSIEGVGHNRHFKGFLIRALNEEGNSIGQFQSMDSQGKNLNCQYANDSLTHSSPTHKNGIKFKWYPPSDPRVDYVNFRAAVVEEKFVWWSGLETRLMHMNSMDYTKSKTSTIGYSLFGLLLSGLVAYLFTTRL